MIDNPLDAYIGQNTEGLEEDTPPVTIWRMRCHACHDEWEANRGEWTCQACGSLCTELLETFER